MPGHRWSRSALRSLLRVTPVTAWMPAPPASGPQCHKNPQLTCLATSRSVPTKKRSPHGCQCRLRGCSATVRAALDDPAQHPSDLPWLLDAPAAALHTAQPAPHGLAHRLPIPVVALHKQQSSRDSSLSRAWGWFSQRAHRNRYGSGALCIASAMELLQGSMAPSHVAWRALSPMALGPMASGFPPPPGSRP